MVKSKNLMKRLLISLAILFCLIVFSIGAVACSNGQNGKDGVGVQSFTINENGELVVVLTDGTSSVVGTVRGEDGKNGADGKDGVNGEDGKDGTDGKDGVNGEDGKDGADGKDGLDGKSAYEIWLNNGHTGTEAEFLTWLKGKDGADGKDGVNGEDGKDGKDGKGIESIGFNEEGKLVIVYTDGTSVALDLPQGSFGACAEHSWLTFMVKEPTCDEEGYTLKICKNNCGLSIYEAIVATGHDWSEYDTIEPTCTEDGYQGRYCLVCGETDGEGTVIPKLNHEIDGVSHVDTYWVVNENETLCENGGQKIEVCDICNEVVSHIRVGAIGHIVDEWTLSTTPTIEEKGKIKGYCSQCKQNVELELPKLNTNDYVYTETQKNTCDEESIGTYAISVKTATGEQKFTFDVVVPAHLHTLANGIEVDANAIYIDLNDEKYAGIQVFANSTVGCGDGLYAQGYFVCADCGETILLENLKVAHTKGDVIKVVAPTCTTKGYTVYKCAVCEEEFKSDYTQTIPHEYKYTFTLNADGKTGTLTGTCSVCGHKDIHKNIVVTIKRIEPTCEEEGKIIYTYIDLEGKEQAITEILSKTNHKLNGVEMPLDVTYYLTSDGSLYYYKGNDKTSDKVVVYTASDIANGAKEIRLFDNTPPACGEAPIQASFDCDKEGSFLISLQADHTKGEFVRVVEPTCETDGYTVYICAECGREFESDHEAALKHDYVYTLVKNANDTFTLSWTCTRDSEHNGSKTVDKVEEKILKNPSCVEEGILQYTYTDPDTKEKVSVTMNMPKTAHMLNELHVDEETVYYVSDDGMYYLNDKDEIEWIYKAADIKEGRTTGVKLFGNSEITCNDDGNYGSAYFVCEYGDGKCGNTILLNKIKTSHDFSNEIERVEATCDTDGHVTYECPTCSKTITEMIPVIGHSWKITAISAPTDVKTGTVTIACAACSDVKVVTLPVLNVTDYEVTEKKADCLNDGKIIYTIVLEDYNDLEVEIIVPTSLGAHEFKDNAITVTWEETVEVDGKEITYIYTAKYCSVCENYVVQEQKLKEPVEEEVK